ncbi:N-acetylglucosamine kinase [Nostoc sp. FACHB-110]|uniref:N-acetylglucosamine kinase n=1 Tax=Nostoc sp. FACHB-110 TaxID=2692834 RepID=UPI0016820E16|nr:BadF/BadG/BcrA/BcrD ATPase family protein [Nostoc sp. FACHB-110]MBD2435271.1 ATPase [Nostoc sp. FACHB-110]
MSYVLGIDGGGTKTVCVLMDDTGKVLGCGMGGASNYHSVGVEATIQSIHSAIYKAANEALKSIDAIAVKAICLGLAGVGRPFDVQIIQGIVKELQNSNWLPINWDLSPSHIIICHDALIALVGGIGDDVGIVVAAGTGSIVFGRNQQGQTHRVGGWGYILGDEGSAYKIAVAGMHTALKSYDGREKITSLVDGFKQHLSLKNIEELIEVVYQRGWGVTEIAALAKVVDIAAVSGDELANQIIDQAVADLVNSTSTVINRIFTDNSSIEIVTVGSVWQGKSQMQERFAASIGNIFPFVKVIHPKYEPAYGAGLLAIKQL